MMESTSELQKIIDKCAKMEEALKKIVKMPGTLYDDNDEQECAHAFWECQSTAEQALS